MLVTMGYTERNARSDVAKFMEYKARQVGPKQVWSDDEAGQEPVPESAPSMKFGTVVAKLKGGRDGQ